MSRGQHSSVVKRPVRDKKAGAFSPGSSLHARGLRVAKDVRGNGSLLHQTLWMTTLYSPPGVYHINSR